MRTNKYTDMLKILPLVALLNACNTTGDAYRADVYKTGQVNQAQEVKTVKLIAVMPARVEVDNSEMVKKTKIGAGLLGAIAGAALGGQSKTSNSNKYVIGGAAGGVAGAAAGSIVTGKQQ